MQLNDITKLLERVSTIAAGAQRKITYLVVVGLAASAYLAWQLFNPESAVWWNAIKCGLVMLPVLVWCFIWYVLSGLQEAPQLVSKIAQQEDGVLSNLQNLSLKQPDGLRGLFSTFRTFRQEQGFSVVLDTIGGVTLLANPVFAAFAFLCAALILLLIIIAPVVLIFA